MTPAQQVLANLKEIMVMVTAMDAAELKQFYLDLQVELSNLELSETDRMQLQNFVVELVNLVRGEFGGASQGLRPALENLEKNGLPLVRPWARHLLNLLD